VSDKHNVAINTDGGLKNFLSDHQYSALLRCNSETYCMPYHTVLLGSRKYIRCRLLKLIMPVSFSLSFGRDVQKQQNKSTSCLDPKNIILYWSPHPHGKGEGFDEAFAKLLWPLVIISCESETYSSRKVLAVVRESDESYCFTVCVVEWLRNAIHQ